MKPACFLDRDGVLVAEVGYLSDPDDLRLIGNAGEAVRDLNEAGVPAILITNQAGVARGLFAESQLEVVHQRLREALAAEGAHLDGIYYCPHHPTAGVSRYTRACTCRKPGPGMLEQAARELDLDLGRSFVIGDKLSDIGAGARAGCQTILVRTGYGVDYDPGHLGPDDPRPDHIVDDVQAAVALCRPLLTRAEGA